MIDHPQVGMRVKYSSELSVRYNSIGTIKRVYELVNQHDDLLFRRVDVEFDSVIGGLRTWPCHVMNLTLLMPLSLDEKLQLENQQRRQAYADKYL